MKINKKRDMTPFDMNKRPLLQKRYLMPLIWLLSYMQTRKSGLKIERRNMEHIKPPYLVLATHQGESDYAIAPLALFPHRASYVSDVEGFAAYGEWLYRRIGCIGKRRYVADVSVIRNIRCALKRGQSVVIYPESRHSNAGTTSLIPENMGRLAKSLGVPLVILSAHGSYLANPFWDEYHTRKVPLCAVLECIYTADELKLADEKGIQQRVAEKLAYDEYDWQRSNHIRITEEKRAEGLQLALYQCRACGTEFRMEAQGQHLCCKECGAQWHLSELGQLEGDDGSIHIPDWYEWQRENVHREINEHGYRMECPVTVEALPNAKGFVPLGEGLLLCDEKRFTLKLADQTLHFPHFTRESVQTEYNYKGKGKCIVLSTRNCCYYIYAQEPEFCPTRIQFAGEYLHRMRRNLKHIAHII